MSQQPSTLLAAAPPQRDLNALAGQAIDRLGAQSDLPRLPVPEGWRFGPFSLNLPDLILLAVLIACACLIAYLAVRFRRTRDDAWNAPREDQLATAPHAQANLARAEEFAAAGRYMEAMHELLLQCVADIRRRGAGRLDESLTSREILRKAPLSPDGRDALEFIVARVEWTYFGLRPADALSWQECRQRFENVAGALAAHV